MTTVLGLAALVTVATASLGGIAYLLVMRPTPDLGSNGQEHQGSAGSIVEGKSGRVVRSGHPVTRVPTASEQRQIQLETRMVQAGVYRKGSTSRFAATQAIIALAPIGLALLCIRMQWVTPFYAIAMAACTAIAGIVGPGLWLDHRKSVRQTSIRRALPDALDVIVVCLEAGVSLTGALVRVSKELRNSYPLLSDEFTIVYREVQLGTSTGQALLHFANRFDLDELRSLSSVVRQAEKFGASLASALRVHADTLRVKRFQLAQERAQKAAVKLLIPTVLCIFPSLFVVILGPAAYDIARMLSEHVSKK